MLLEALVEVRRAYACVDDCKNNQDDGDNSEAGQVLSDGHVIGLVALLIHPSKLENEVSQSAEEEEDGNDHSKDILATRPEGCHEQNYNSNGDSGDCQAIFRISETRNNDKELHRKSEEEEEIEFEQSNVNLENF